MNKIWSHLKKWEKTVAKDIKNSLTHLENDLRELPAGTEEILNFYSSKSLLPHTQSPSRLASWLSAIHPGYGFSSWCFYGRIESDQGVKAAITSMVQHNFKPDPTPTVSEWSFCDDRTDGYRLAPFLTGDTHVEYAEPFAITANAVPVTEGLINISLVSGQMGQAGAQYKMTGRVVELSLGFDMWEYDLLMTDTLGAIQVGYGPSSFYPQWLTDEQRSLIETDYHNDVHAYLKASGDTMIGQGSYYYSLPLLRVDACSIFKNNQPYFSGNKGDIWVDYVVQSFTGPGTARVKQATWKYFAIQFPEIAVPGMGNLQAALVGSIIYTPDSSGVTTNLPMARFYAKGAGFKGEQAENGALKTCCEWNMDQITFTTTETWTQPGPGGKTFVVGFDLHLISPEATIKIRAKAIRNNQVIPLREAYEGSFEVSADIQWRDIDQHSLAGIGWAEVQT